MCQRIFSITVINLLCLLVALPPAIDAKPGLLSRIKKRKNASRQAAQEARMHIDRTSGAKRILYLGDSMSMGAFGRTFDTRLREAGFSVYTYVAGGATPYYWLSRYAPIASNIGFWHKSPVEDMRIRSIDAVPKVEGLIKDCEPDIVVVQTGTNLYASLVSKRRTREGNIREVEGLCRNMAKASTRDGIQCYWIAPPSSHPERYPVNLQQEMEDLMKRVVGEYGRVFDSRRVTEYIDSYPKNDGIHYGPTEAKQWAGIVADDFVHYARGKRTARLPSGRGELPSGRGELPSGRGELPVGGVNLPDVPVNRGESKPLIPRDISWGEIDVTIQLATKTNLPPKSIVTYKSCLVLYEYEVIEVHSGYYPLETIRVAHYGVLNRKATVKARYKIGAERSWQIVPLDRYPSMLRLQMVDDLEPDFQKPIYVIKQS